MKRECLNYLKKKLMKKGQNMKNVKTKIGLKIQKDNLERLENYVKQNNLKFAAFVREAIEDYFKIPQEKRGVK